MTVKTLNLGASVQYLDVEADYAGQRIDNFLLTHLKGAPRSLVYRILRKGEVRVNKGRVKPEYRLQAGDTIRVPPVRLPERDEPKKPGGKLTALLEKAILYEDKGFMVINKPSGLAVHGGSGVQLGLIEAMRHIRPESKHLELVHRLDRDTSGCVLLAKKRSSLLHAQKELREGRMNKVYHALVTGRWPKRRQHVNVPLLKNQLASGERIVKAVAEGVEGAKRSLTEYRILESFEGATLVEAKPITGRTHQIRVHCLHAGCPILGDPKYGEKEANQAFQSQGLKRLFLHAYQLGLNLGDGKRLDVTAPLDEELSHCLKILGG